jgi:hypothetical protein
MRSNSDATDYSVQAQVRERHASLKPLARNHGVDLVFALFLRKAARAATGNRHNTLSKIRQTFEHNILSSLQDEYRILVPFVPASFIEEFNHRHGLIREKIGELVNLERIEDPGAKGALGLAKVLEDYVRWEERMLYPSIETTSANSALSELQRMSDQIQNSRFWLKGAALQLAG